MFLKMRPQRSSKYGFLMISPPKKLNVDGLHQFQASGGTHAEEPDRAPPALPLRRDKLCRSQQVEGLPSQKIHCRQAEILGLKSYFRGHGDAPIVIIQLGYHHDFGRECDQIGDPNFHVK